MAHQSRRTPSLIFRFLAWLARQTLGRYLSVRCHGLDHLPVDGPYIVASNHLSTLDPVLLMAYLTRSNRLLIAPVAKKGLFFWPLNVLLRSLGAISVDRSGGRNLGAIRAMMRTLRSRPILIFPEGGVMFAEARVSGKMGVGFLAQKTGASIVPACVTGTHRALPKGGRWIRKTPVTISFGEPIIMDESTRSSKPEQVTDRVMQAIEGLKPSADSRRSRR